jgi:hypothetical protein
MHNYLVLEGNLGSPFADCIRRGFLSCDGSWERAEEDFL